MENEYSDNSKVNAEVLGVLMALGIDFINKMPSYIMEYLTANCSKEDIPQIDNSIPINKQPVSKEAKNFLIALNLLYCCDSEEKKEEILKKIIQNTK